MNASAHGKGRPGAIVVGALCIGFLVYHLHPTLGCFVNPPGGKRQRHQKGTAWQLHSVGTMADAPPSETLEEELKELKVAGIGNGTSGTEPEAVRSTDFWDSLLATPWLPDFTDASVAALGAGFGLAFVSYLDGISPVRLYAGPLASSAILIFANSKPPPVKNVLIGTAGPAAGSVLCHTLLSQFLPNVVTRSLSVGISLVFFKFTGFFFPPAAAIAALGVENETFANLSWSYIIFPAVTGNALLYGLALLLSEVREKIRAQLTAQQWRMGTRDENLIKEIFERCDLDRSGMVDENELNVAMRYLVGRELSLELTSELMAQVDTDGDGNLDLNEFTQVFEAYERMEASKTTA